MSISQENFYRLIKPYDSNLLHVSSTMMGGASKCYKELKKVSPAYAKYIKKNLKLIDIAGENDEILVYNCKFLDAGINKEIKDFKSKVDKKTLK